jgi:NADH dehydrogenase (ubiquinone) 1 alpha subcomplex subunit 9
MPYSTRDLESVQRTMTHSDVVINMIGKHYETKHFVPTRRANGNLSRVNYDLEEVHVTIPRMLAREAKKAGATCFIHMSGELMNRTFEVKKSWRVTVDCICVELFRL